MRCLALDVGERRTGIALGERIARPLATMQRRSRAEDFARVASLIRRHDVDRVVVGLPLNMDGSQGAQARRVTRYAGRMMDALAEMGLDVDLVLWDERLTTEEAVSVMDLRGGGRSGRGHSVDAVAATLILQSYLDREGPAADAGAVL